MPKVIILSGPSGCGKSTWAAANHPDAVVCSADHHFIDTETGEYKFDPTKLGEAHSNCMAKFIEAVQSSEADIVVDNTNLANWERQNYHSVAEMVGLRVEYHTWVVHTVHEIWACARRNKHGVQVEVIAKMALNHDYNPGIFHTIEG